MAPAVIFFCTETCSVRLPVHVKDVLNETFTCLGFMFVLLFVSPAIAALLVPLILFFAVIQTAYLRRYATQLSSTEYYTRPLAPGN